MLFLKKHGWWVLSIVIGMCISAGILAYRSKGEGKFHLDVLSGDPLRPEAAEIAKRPLNLSTPRQVRKVTEPKMTHDHDNHFGFILSAHTHPAAPPRLPADIQARIDEIYQEMLITSTFFEIRNGEKVVTEAAYKRLYDVLVGGMSPEATSHN